MILAPSLSRRSRKPVLAGLTMAASVSALLMTAPSAWAQSRDMEDVANRLSRLETDVQTLSRDVYRNGAKPSGPVAGGSGSSAAGEVEVLRLQMETQQQQQTGKYEELAYQVSQMKDRLDKLAADMDLRLQKLEEKAGMGLAADGGGSSPAAPPSGKGDGGKGDAKGDGGKGDGGSGKVPPLAAAPASAAGNLPQGAVQEQYDYAFGLLRQNDYAGAEKAFTQFLQQNPDTPLAANAQYWLGESLYARKDYKNAAIAFGDGYKKYPKSNKNADFLLKLAMSLGNMDQKANACVVLKQLDGAKDISPVVKRRGDEEKAQFGCR